MKCWELILLLDRCLDSNFTDENTQYCEVVLSRGLPGLILRRGLDHVLVRFILM